MTEDEKNKLKLSLNEVLEKWIEKCDLLDVYLGRNTIHFMAEAALSVIVACQESQKEMEEGQ